MWSVQIHPLVFEEDFPKIDRSAQQRIIKAIYKKLSSSPDEYGRPLTGPLKGYWRLRVDDHRVIYRIEKDEIRVFVIKVGVRKDDEVYLQIPTRLKKLAN